MLCRASSELISASVLETGSWLDPRRNYSRKVARLNANGVVVAIAEPKRQSANPYFVVVPRIAVVVGVATATRTMPPSAETAGVNRNSLYPLLNHRGMTIEAAIRHLGGVS
jgi:hypothetical protein